MRHRFVGRDGNQGKFETRSEGLVTRERRPKDPRRIGSGSEEFCRTLQVKAIRGKPLDGPQLGIRRAHKLAQDSGRLP